MIWFAIAAVLSVAVAVAALLDRGDVGEAIFAFFFTGVFAGLGALAASILIGVAVYDPDEYSYTFDVMAAKDGSSTEGHFGIFGGFIDEKAYYFFYRQYSDGRIEQGKIRANRTSIYQDQETNAYIKAIKTRTSLRFWGLTQTEDGRYEIHVPEGAVTTSVEFDLE